MKEPLDIFFMDQLEAAHKDAVQMLDKLYRERGVKSEKSNVPFIDTYYGQKYKEVFLNNIMQYCNHIDFKIPSVVYSSISRPHKTLCFECFGRYETEEAKNFPTRCDYCFTEGHINFMHLALPIGNTIVSGNVCHSCHKKHMDSAGVGDESTNE